MADNSTRISKCPGRFPEARTILAEAVNLLKGSAEFNNISSLEDLSAIVDLVGKNDLLYGDCKDPYFYNRSDLLRTDPLMAQETNLPIAILPLIFKDLRLAGVSIDEALLDRYPRLFGALELSVNGLRPFHRSSKVLDKQLGIDLSKLVFPRKDARDTTTLQGYHLEGDFGIGGTGGVQIVSDCPYMVYLVKTGKPNASEEEDKDKQSLGIGFWYNSEDTLLLSQIQQPRGSLLPNEIHMGILGLHIATYVARKIGARRIQTYSARNHPLFIQHPDSRAQLEGEFKCLYDKSASVLGWHGTHGEYYELDLGFSPEASVSRLYTKDPATGSKKNPCDRSIDQN